MIVAIIVGFGQYWLKWFRDYFIEFPKFHILLVGIIKTIKLNY